MNPKFKEDASEPCIAFTRFGLLITALVLITVGMTVYQQFSGNEIPVVGDKLPNVTDILNIGDSKNETSSNETDSCGDNSTGCFTIEYLTCRADANDLYQECIPISSTSPKVNSTKNNTITLIQNQTTTLPETQTAASYGDLINATWWGYDTWNGKDGDRVCMTWKHRDCESELVGTTTACRTITESDKVYKEKIAEIGEGESAHDAICNKTVKQDKIFIKFKKASSGATTATKSSSLMLLYFVLGSAFLFLAGFAIFTRYCFIDSKREVYS